MGVWILCFFLLALGTARVDSSDERWNEIEHSPKDLSDVSMKNVVQLLQSLIIKVAQNATEVQLETNAVEEAALQKVQQVNESVHILSNEHVAAGGAQNETSSVTLGDGNNNGTTLGDGSGSSNNGSTLGDGNNGAGGSSNNGTTLGDGSGSNNNGTTLGDGSGSNNNGTTLGDGSGSNNNGTTLGS